MKHNGVILFGGLVLWVLLAAPNTAWSENALTVYIECNHPERPNTQGSGVLVNSEGFVLTARHVAPEGYECKGAIENKTNPLRGLVRPVQDRSLDKAIDGKLLRFVPNEGENFDFATYCPLRRSSLGRPLTAKGFHATSVGLPAQSSGVLSTYIGNDVGIVETDVITVRGKSGGPVFLTGTRIIIGIVAGAQFDEIGVPRFYGVLAADAVSFDFGVMRISPDCNAADIHENTGPARRDDGGTAILEAFEFEDGIRLTIVSRAGDLPAGRAREFAINALESDGAVSFVNSPNQPPQTELRYFNRVDQPTAELFALFLGLEGATYVEAFSEGKRTLELWLGD